MASAHADFNGGYLCLRLPRGWQVQSLRLLSRAAEKVLRAEDSFPRLELMRDCGHLFHLAGRSEKGLELLVLATEEAERLGHLTALPLTYGMKTSLLKSMGRFEAAEEAGWKGYHLAQALENQRDLVLNACNLAQTLVLRGKLDEATAFMKFLKGEQLSTLPYLQLVQTRLDIEMQLAQKTIEGGQRAVELCDKGLQLCRETDELRYHRNYFRVRRVQGLLHANEHLSLDKELWTALERRLRSFPYLRFDLKLLKLRWTAEMGDTASVSVAAEKLLQRDECSDFHRQKILSLVETVTASS